MKARQKAQYQAELRKQMEEKKRAKEVRTGRLTFMFMLGSGNTHHTHAAGCCENRRSSAASRQNNAPKTSALSERGSRSRSSMSERSEKQRPRPRRKHGYVGQGPTTLWS